MYLCFLLVFSLYYKRIVKTLLDFTFLYSCRESNKNKSIKIILFQNVLALGFLQFIMTQQVYILSFTTHIALDFESKHSI